MRNRREGGEKKRREGDRKRKKDSDKKNREDNKNKDNKNKDNKKKNSITPLSSSKEGKPYEPESPKSVDRHPLQSLSRRKNHLPTKRSSRRMRRRKNPAMIHE